MSNQKQSGIYKITNILNNHCYIGSAVNINRRFITHKHKLKYKTHHSSYLLNAWNKYGSQAFIYETLFYCSKSDLIFYEQRAIDTYKPEYNMCPTAGSSLGRIVSDETRKRLSDSGKGRIVSDETRKRLSESKKGKRMSQEAIDRMAATKRGKKLPPRSPEACANLSKALMGHNVSEETKQKQSERAKQKIGVKNHRFGVAMSQETKDKISVKAQNRVVSQETKEKISSSLRILNDTPEMKTKRSNAAKGNKARLGKKHSEETKKKMSDSAKQRVKQESDT